MTTAPRRSLPGLLLLALAGVAVVVIVAIAWLSDRDSDPADEAGSDAPISTAAPLAGDCENLHADHSIAMWNAVMADEMTEAGCSFPYEPFLVPMDGGEEDPTIAAPFEPRLYDDVFQMISEVGLGVCQVATLPDPSADGFTFGFRVTVGPPGCPNVGDNTVVLREYATRAFRDEAAHGADAERTLVLGRWVVAVEAADSSIGEQVIEGLVGLGAAEVG